MLITDALALDAASVRRTRDGYLVATARIARTGVQTYRAAELGLADRDPDAPVRVYRPAEEVFAADAMASLAHRPLTLDHPAEPVTAANWRQHAVGATGGEVVRDGDTVRVPLTLMDAAAIAAVEAGQRELSVGYSCELRLDAGTSPEGEPYDAVQRTIRGNHVALCAAARGGPRLRLGDAEPALIVGDVAVIGLSAAARQAVEALQGRAAALETEAAELRARLRDAEPGPERLQALAAARAQLLADAARVGGAALADSRLADAELRRAAVAARLGAAAAELSDAAVEGAFAALLAAGAPDPVRAALADGPAAVDARQAHAAARAARLAHLGGAHRAGAAA